MKDLKGFILIKFVMVIAIIAILGIVAVRVYKNYIKKPKIAPINIVIEESVSENDSCGRKILAV
ncbi:MAG: hypothetical protein LBU29_01705 [Endomicrobium sp.]|jgi:Tfp pilus assembly protein PilE|nr:hypothetical protein [Endomicrobium sp.]